MPLNVTHGENDRSIRNRHVVASEGRTVFHDDTEVECITIAENRATLNLERSIINLLAPELFFLILAHPVYKI